MPKRFATIFVMLCTTLLLALPGSALTTITPVDTTTFTGEWTSIAIASNGFPVIAYHDESDDSLKILICTSANCSGDTPVVLDDPAGPTPDVGDNGISLALDANDIPVIAYHDNTNGDLKLVRCTDSTCTALVGGAPVVVDNGGGTNDVGEEPSLALNNSGNPVIAYYDATAQDMLLLVCDDPICASETPVDVHQNVGGLIQADNSIDPGTPAVGLGASLALDANDIPIIAYHQINGSNKAALVARCATADCAGGAPAADINILPNAFQGNAGRYTSMALNEAGNPVVAFQRNADLRIVVCSAPDCDTTLSSETINVGTSAFYHALALAPSGFPIIAFQQNPSGPGNNFLSLLRCNDVACAGGDDPLETIDDSSNDVGQFLDLALDANGDVFISYFAPASDDLILANQTPDCVVDITGSVTENTADLATVTIDCGGTSFTPSVFGIEIGLDYGDFTPDDAFNGTSADDLLNLQTPGSPWSQGNFGTANVLSTVNTALGAFAVSKQGSGNGLAVPGTLGSVQFTAEASIQLNNLEDDEPDALLLCETIKLADENGAPLDALCTFNSFEVTDTLDAQIAVDALNIESDGDMTTGGQLGFTLVVRDESNTEITTTSLSTAINAYDETDGASGNGSAGNPEILNLAAAYTGLGDAESPFDLILEGTGHINCLAVENFALRDQPTVNNIGGNLTLLAGDAANTANDAGPDLQINQGDADAIATDFGGSPSGSRESDVNGDGAVNVLDLVHVGRNFGAGDGNLNACPAPSSPTTNNDVD